MANFFKKLSMKNESYIDFFKWLYIYNFNSIVVDEITNSMIYYIIIFILKIYNN